MAAIDKIYGTTKEYDIFRSWISKNKQEYLVYFYPRDGYDKDRNRPITNLPELADMWLLKNCALDFIIERIKEQYDIE